MGLESTTELLAFVVARRGRLTGCLVNDQRKRPSGAENHYATSFTQDGIVIEG
jgi:hypothetical protein